MKLALCRTLLIDRKILFLDEPTIGLDLLAKDSVRAFLQHINQKYKTTILLTTHDLHDVEELCQRILVIDQGKLIFDDSINELKKQVGDATVISATLNHPLDQTQQKQSTESNGVKLLSPLEVAVEVEGGSASNTAAIRKLLDRFDVREIMIKEPEIEEIIRKIYKSSASLHG